MIVRGYIDDSGTHTEAPLTMAACVFGRDEEWGALEPQWQALLGEYRLKYVHCTDLQKRRKQFRRWSDNVAQRFVQEATDLIKGAGLFTIAAHVREGDLQDYFHGKAGVAKFPAVNAFGICVWAAIDEILTVLKHTKGCEDVFVTLYAEGKKDAARVQELVNWSRRHTQADLANRVAEKVIPVEKIETAAIQVADMVAYTMYSREKLPAVVGGQRSTDKTVCELRNQIVRVPMTPAELTSRMEALEKMSAIR